MYVLWIIKMTTKHTLTIIQQNPKPPNDSSPSQPLSVTYPCHLDLRRLNVFNTIQNQREPVFLLITI